MAWFDAGINLFDEKLAFDQMLENASSVGVEKVCLIATHPDEWSHVQALYAKYPERVVYTLGIHPHHAKDANNQDFAQLEQLICAPGMVAVGECGLDFNRNFSPADTQLDVFKRQLQLAKASNMPVYLHERDAFLQQIDCLQSVFDGQVKGIAHCFTGSTQQMQTYLDLGLYIGITGWLCDTKRGETLRQAISELPEHRLIFETDAPYLFPKNARPRKRYNEPRFLPYVAAEYGELTGISVESLEQTSYVNTHALFAMDTIECQ